MMHRATKRMNGAGMSQTRVRKGVSLGAETVATLETMVAEGIADSVSAAIDLAVSEYRRRKADADLVAAASGLDVAEEAEMPGVLGNPDRDEDDPGGPTWASVVP